MITQIIKRDGRVDQFDVTKIENAIIKAMNAIGRQELNDCKKISKIVEVEIETKFVDAIPDVESVQDVVEEVLMQNGYKDVAKEYI